MSEASIALFRIQEEAGAATVYFHTWWALRNLAIPTYLPTMNNHTIVDFFHAANTGFIKLTFVSLSKIFDSDDRALGMRGVRKLLSASGHQPEADLLEKRFVPHTDLVKRILGIRNRSVGHNEAAISRNDVYATYGVTPDEIRDLVTEVRTTINEVARRLGAANDVSDGGRSERAVMALLEQLKHGASVA